MVRLHPRLLYILWFVVWTGNLWLLLGELVIFDLYFTHLFLQLRPARTTANGASAARPTNRLRMGQRDHFRHGRSLAHRHIFIFQMYVIPVVVDGVIAADRRLPLREQGGLRPPDAQHAGVVPVRTPYDALFADEKIVLRMRSNGLTTGSRDCAASSATTWWSSTFRRRHGAAQRQDVTYYDVLREYSARWAPGGPRAADAGLHGHHPPGGQARELHQTLRGHRGRLARIVRAARSTSTDEPQAPSPASSSCIW